MVGAVIGDIIGSRFEKDNIKHKDFEFFTNQSRFTDDTVLTIAIACLLYTSPSPRDATLSRMPSSA